MRYMGEMKKKHGKMCIVIGQILFSEIINWPTINHVGLSLQLLKICMYAKALVMSSNCSLSNHWTLDTYRVICSEKKSTHTHKTHKSNARRKKKTEPKKRYFQINVICLWKWQNMDWNRYIEHSMCAFGSIDGNGDKFFGQAHFSWTDQWFHRKSGVLFAFESIRSNMIQFFRFMVRRTKQKNKMKCVRQLIMSNEF